MSKVARSVLVFIIGALVGAFCMFAYHWFEEEHVQLANFDPQSHVSSALIWKREFPLGTLRVELLIRRKGASESKRFLLTTGVDMPVDVEMEFTDLHVANNRVCIISRHQFYKGPDQFNF